MYFKIGGCIWIDIVISDVKVANKNWIQVVTGITKTHANIIIVYERSLEIQLMKLQLISSQYLHKIIINFSEIVKFIKCASLELDVFIEIFVINWKADIYYFIYMCHLNHLDFVELQKDMVHWNYCKVCNMYIRIALSQYRTQYQKRIITAQWCHFNSD